MDKLPIYKLVINESEDSLEEVNFISLVEFPAIERNFYYFNNQKFVEPNLDETKDEFLDRCISYVINEGKDNEQAVAICNSMWDSHFAENTFNDYPQEATENAKIALRWAEENGWGSCGTPVGKARANQLANRESISKETISRMASFERHRENSKKELGDGCGRLMWLAWGGDAGVEWAQRKLEQLNTKKFSIQNEEERVVSGPMMIADLPIYRRDEQGEYYVVFTAEEIKKIVQKFFKKGYQSNVNLEHKIIADDVYLFESYIINREKGVNPPNGFEDIPDGSWFGSHKIENDAIWAKVKDGTYKGFSVEGLFNYKIETTEDIMMSKIIEILKQIEH